MNGRIGQGRSESGDGCWRRKKLPGDKEEKRRRWGRARETGVLGSIVAFPFLI